MQAFGQSRLLSPTAEFDLNAGSKAHHLGRIVRSSFAATPNGLTWVTIGEKASLTSADLDGRILHSRSDLASVNAQIYAALPRQDGSVWLVSSGPHNLFDNFATGDFAIGPLAPPAGRASTPVAPYNQMDLYSPAGARLTSLRLLTPVDTWEKPLAAANDQLVLLSTTHAGFTSPQSELIRFGTVTGGQFKERTLVRLAPPVNFAFALLASNGDLLLINRTSGSMVVIDPMTHRDSVVQLARPHPVRAAAVDANDLYLLSIDVVLKTDLAGQLLSTYRFHFSRRFEPVTLGVTASVLYLVDKAGRVERFQVP